MKIGHTLGMNVTNNPQRSRFELEQDGQVAVADYDLEGNIMTVTHVIVPPALRGGGLATALAAEVVAHARRENLKIIPQCSFMVAYVQRHPEVKDLLA